MHCTRLFGVRKVEPNRPELPKSIHGKRLAHEQRGRPCPAGLTRPLGMDICDRLLRAVVLQVDQCYGEGFARGRDPPVPVCIHPCQLIHPKPHIFRETSFGL